jgi:hypothetical protein
LWNFTPSRIPPEGLRSEKRYRKELYVQITTLSNRLLSLHFIAVRFPPLGFRAVAAWLQRADVNDSLGCYFNPPLTPEEREVAAVEGWIIGVV